MPCFNAVSLVFKGHLKPCSIINLKLFFLRSNCHSCISNSRLTVFKCSEAEKALPLLSSFTSSAIISALSTCDATGTKASKTPGLNPCSSTLSTKTSKRYFKSSNALPRVCCPRSFLTLLFFKQLHVKETNPIFCTTKGSSCLSAMASAAVPLSIEGWSLKLRLRSCADETCWLVLLASPYSFIFFVHFLSARICGSLERSQQSIHFLLDACRIRKAHYDYQPALIKKLLPF